MNSDPTPSPPASISTDALASIPAGFHRPRRTPEQWAEIIQRQLDSGISVAAFAAVEGVSVPSIYAWRRKLRDASLDPAPRLVRLDAVDVASSSTTSLIAAAEVRLTNGVVVRLDATPDLRSLLAAAASVPASSIGAASC